MDLHSIETYLRPNDLSSVQRWSQGWAWLAGGTWLFSEPQPTLNTLVDLEPLNWSDIELNGDRLAIGATCTFTQLLNYNWPVEWQAIAALKSAISALSASFKVLHLATIGGNLCLALAVGVMAPLMVLLDATYEIWSPITPPALFLLRTSSLGFKKPLYNPATCCAVSGFQPPFSSGKPACNGLGSPQPIPPFPWSWSPVTQKPLLAESVWEPV